MTWKDLTTPPPPRRLPPKAPLFTTDFFSTRSFGPGHLIGAAALGLGLYGTIKYAIDRGRAAQARQPLSPERPASAQLAQTNVRGQYGRRA